jgi:hypothetical protein
MDATRIPGFGLLETPTRLLHEGYDVSLMITERK